MLQWLYTYVPSVYPQCFICFLYTYVASVSNACLKCFICLLLYIASVVPGCFKGMLQLFRIDVAKVDRDIAYVAMTIHVCCKRLFQMFYLFFQMYVASVFIWMLRMFHTYVCKCFCQNVAYVLQWLFKCF